ncbi:DUF2357 domain-containing protein [Geomonas paludis]|uniref:DUF2357 domain-containing protein n=1 Tax=Geomonas paludis TaxID=2740185 RepID=A0ABY4LLX0_9BACT|nr:DUF2357 domain-containing protein [Geomonas paludis]UPU37508.1 DUF2357 domain-containing protein [Geomonas paludis]
MSEQQTQGLTPRQQRMMQAHREKQRAAAVAQEPVRKSVQGPVPKPVQEDVQKPVQVPLRHFESVESLYKALREPEAARTRALLLLTVRGWLTDISDFDPVTAHSLPTGMVDFLDAVAQVGPGNSCDGGVKDRIFRIASHTGNAIKAILEHTREKILSEHAMLPIHAAREVDSNSVKWLSRQPGRTIREKLAGKPYIKAVRRRSSLDTSENRLLKAFLFRLEQVLVARQSALPAASDTTCEDLLVVMQGWLRSEDAAEIGPWGNLPPNNPLLQDKRYRKVWDAWIWLQGIDEHIAGDSDRIRNDLLSVLFWRTLSLLNRTGRLRIIQQPVEFDYDSFRIDASEPINGYFFPLLGEVKLINGEKNFGVLCSEGLPDLIFKGHNLSGELQLGSLKKGDTVSFRVGENARGKYADNVAASAHPRPVSFLMSDCQITVLYAEGKITVGIGGNDIVVKSGIEGTIKRFPLNASALEDVPDAVAALCVGASVAPGPCDRRPEWCGQAEVAIVDLCSVRPKFTRGAGSPAHLPFRLLRQNWRVSTGEVVPVDCGNSKAMAIRPDVETVSMRSLFSASSPLPESVKSSASMYFSSKLSSFMQAKSLYYLLPDWGNEFDLECIRKSINFYFQESTPLPKSIVAIFAWQSSRQFEQENVRDNDIVLVVDVFNGGISITPVQAVYQCKLHEILPQSKGITWERHPTFTSENREMHASKVRNLSRDGCRIAEQLMELYAFDGLVSDAGALSIADDEGWYHVPASIRAILNRHQDKNALSFETVNNCLGSLSKDFKRANVFILPLEESIKKPAGRFYNWLWSPSSPIHGCQVLNQWQESAGDIPLWRDHLPTLSVRIVRDGRFENFYLVEDATTTPQRGRAVPIPIKDSFILPPNQKYYEFPLQQGEGNQELKFVAYLKSPAFPLKAEMICKLKMTYTYGADDPYELRFIPLDPKRTEFKSILVEWRPIGEKGEVDLSTLPVPSYPSRKSWAEFQAMAREGGPPSNLLANIETELAYLDSIAKYGRTTAQITSDWRVNDKGFRFAFADGVYLPEFALDLTNGQEPPPRGSFVSFYKVENRGMFSGRNITLSEAKPKRLFTSRFNFSVFTVWDSGHSLSEPDVPNGFRIAVSNAINHAVNLIESESTPDTHKEELIFFLSRLHKDAPFEISEKLVTFAGRPDTFRRWWRNIAYAIGTGDLPWQQELLAIAIDATADQDPLTSSIALEMLAIALWRSQDLIAKIPETRIVSLVERLAKCLESDLDALTSDVPENRLAYHLAKKLNRLEAIKRERGYQSARVCKHLELLFALIRTRDSSSESIKEIFHPHKESTTKFVTMVNDISKVFIDNNLDLNCRIGLQIDKPEMFRKTPDLLYALRMYLTGSSGANTICITGVSDDG